MNIPNSSGKRLPFIITGIIILAASLLIARYFMTNNKKPKRKRPVTYMPSVEVKQIRPLGTFIRIPAMGKIKADKKVSLKSQVAGKIIWTSPKLTEGGIFRKGETILKIYPKDYELELTQKKALLENAKYEIKLEMGQQDLAKRQWEILGKTMKSSKLERELALRTPHLIKKNAALLSAKASVEQARINLSRTIIKAPYNGIIQNVAISPGDIATTGTTFAELIDINKYQLILSVPVDAVKWISLSRKKHKGSPVYIKSSSGKKFTGHAVKLHSGLEDEGRMAKVTIIINDPLEFLHRGHRSQQSLLIGEYISSTIKGSYIKGISKIPAAAVHDGNKIWITDKNSRLKILEIKIIWRDNENIYTKSLDSKTEIIISDIATPVEGLKLNILHDEEKGTKGERL